jgi:hypothetical protein
LRLLTFAGESSARGKDFLGQVRRRVRQGRLFLVGGGWGYWCWCRCRSTGPDQDFALLINGQPLRLNEFLLEGFQVLVIKLELHLEGAVGNAPTALKEVAYVLEHGIKIHRCSPS